MRITTLLLLAVWLGGCGAKLDCKLLEERLSQCRHQVYLALSGPEAKLLQTLSTKEGGLAEPARAAVAARWRALERVESEHLVSRMAKTCRRHRGRVVEAEEIRKCLDRKDCQALARCLAHALKKDRTAPETQGKAAAPRHGRSTGSSQEARDREGIGSPQSAESGRPGRVSRPPAQPTPLQPRP